MAGSWRCLIRFPEPSGSGAAGARSGRGSDPDGKAGAPDRARDGGGDVRARAPGPISSPAAASSTIVVPVTLPPAGTAGEVVIKIIIKPAA